MRFMYDGKYAPLGEHLCFVKATPSEVLAAFDSWYKKLNWGGTPYEGYEGKFEIYNVSGTLIDVFQSLSPYDNDLKMAFSFPQSLRFSRDSEGEGLCKPKQ